MKVIGITGNIGSGKSRAAHILENLGAVYIDADKIGHELYNLDKPTRKEIEDIFGTGILNLEGTIDRKKLSRIVFNDPKNLEKLNKVMHPKIRAEVETLIKQHQKQGKRAVIIEATLLVEAGWADMVDEIWLVIAPREVTLERLRSRGLPESEALTRLEAQTSPEILKVYATVVIDNNGNLDDLKSKIEDLWEKRIN